MRIIYYLQYIVFCAVIFGCFSQNITAQGLPSLPSIKSPKKVKPDSNVDLNFFINKLNIDPDCEDWTLTVYEEKNYAEKKKPLDFSDKINNKPLLTKKVLYNMLLNILYNNNLIDPSSTLFTNKNKAAFLNVSLEEFSCEIVANKVSKNLIYEPIFTATATINWELVDTYQQKKFEKKIKVKSKKINLYSFNKIIRDDLHGKIHNTIEKSFKKFLSSKEVKDFKEKKELIEVDPITINKPTNISNGLNEAKSSTVTIKIGNKGHGSGFFINNEGYIVTSYHVVAGVNNDLSVITDEGVEFDANIVRVDVLSDLAIIKVDNKNNYALPLPKVVPFNVGEEVYAIGTPQSIELGQTLSKGIVSGSRKLNNVDIIQSDVSINAGNGGGPLVDPEGKLIGIVSSKISDFGIEGISFMIPASKISKFLKIEFK